MMITAIDTHAVWGGARNFLFVTVDTDEGVSGVGESGLTGRELAVEGAVRHLALLLVGEDPRRIEHLWQLMARGGFFPALGAQAAAMSAIDIALWDIRAKALDVPLHDLLGGRSRERVVCYPHCNEVGVEPLVESARRAVAEGWKFVRWGLPPQGDVFEPRIAIRTALEQFEALRAALGDDVELCMDVHTRLDPADAVTLLRAVEPYRPYFMEDPVRAEDMNALRRVRRQTAVPIAAGEQFHSKWQFRQVIEGDLTKYPNIDLCLAGGTTEAFQSPLGDNAECDEPMARPPNHLATTSSSPSTTRSARWQPPPACTSTSPAPTWACRNSPDSPAPCSPTWCPCRWNGRTATCSLPPAPASASSSTAPPPTPTPSA